ncbi:ester cyclase [Streptomyces olivochromogenes]|uniref:ester cyclase n=1 Tax=Streptomyces olivochromogenes TaxID=1963 RepID=UPI000D14F96F|nr:ester cyclase [Streptomyces olivochromogenes]
MVHRPCWKSPGCGGASAARRRPLCGAVGAPILRNSNTIPRHGIRRTNHASTHQVGRRTHDAGFTSEFLLTGDSALARKFISPGIVMHFGGRAGRSRVGTRISTSSAANMKAFPDLRRTVEDMRAEGDSVAIAATPMR